MSGYVLFKENKKMKDNKRIEIFDDSNLDIIWGEMEGALADRNKIILCMGECKRVTFGGRVL